MDAEREAREVYERGEVDCQAPNCSCGTACDVAITYLAAALRRAHEEAIEECAALVERCAVPTPPGDGDIARDLTALMNAQTVRLAAAIRALKEAPRG